MTGHLRVARQQRLDEVWLTEQMKAANHGAGAPKLPPELECPTRAWKLLTDESEFPQLVALLDDGAFKIDAFRTNYKLAKGDLERKAGFEARSTEALVEAAQKLSCRSEKFRDVHRGALSDDIVKCIEDMVGEVQKACNNKGRPSEIEKAIDGLGKAVACAIRAVYPLSIGTAAQDSAPPRRPRLRATQAGLGAAAPETT